MVEPVEVCPRCYKEIEDWLEEIYHQYPFHRIFRNGKRLGHDGFIENFGLQIEASGSIVEVKVFPRLDPRRVAHSEKFVRGG